MNLDPSEIPSGLDDKREILVCGAFYSDSHENPLCVDKQLKSLIEKGYNASVYLPATVLSYLLHKDYPRRF